MNEAKQPEPELANLPTTSFAEAIGYLRRPFTPEAVHWKVQNANAPRTGANVVGYIDARLVIERLNLVVGYDWFDEYEPYPGAKDLVCHLTVLGVTRTDVGFSTHSLKACHSDALKRAGVKFGVGVSLYATQAHWLEAADSPAIGSNGRPQLLRRQRQGRDKPEVFITAAVETWLRDDYREWIEKGSGQIFGVALDHGDVEGSAGSLLDEGGESSEPVEQATLEADAKVAEIEKLYEENAPPSSPGRKKLSPAKFKAQLQGAGTDPALLASLRAAVAQLKEEAK